MSRMAVFGVGMVIGANQVARSDYLMHEAFGPLEPGSCRECGWLHGQWRGDEVAKSPAVE